MQGSPLWDNERLIFVVLAAFVWLFIFRTVYGAIAHRRQLQRELDGLQATTPQAEDVAPKEKAD